MLMLLRCQYMAGRLDHCLVVAPLSKAPRSNVFSGPALEWVRANAQTSRQCRGKFDALEAMVVRFIEEVDVPRLHPATFGLMVLGKKGFEYGALLHKREKSDMYGAMLIIVDLVAKDDCPAGLEPSPWWGSRNVRMAEWTCLASLIALEEYDMSIPVTTFARDVQAALAKACTPKPSTSADEKAMLMQRTKIYAAFISRPWSRLRAQERAAGGARPAGAAFEWELDWLQCNVRALPSVDIMPRERKGKGWTRQSFYRHLYNII